MRRLLLDTPEGNRLQWLLFKWGYRISPAQSVDALTPLQREALILLAEDWDKRKQFEVSQSVGRSR